MRLDRFLAECGIGTRTEVKKIIRSGAVAINGIPATKADIHLNVETDTVTLSGNEVVYRQFIYLMLNKPQGYISATRDGKTPTVMELIPDEYMHFEPFPVGRLDIDTEGFLLLSNDGDLAHRLLAPKKHIPKTYVAQIEKPITDADIKQFTAGVILDDGYKTMPATLKRISSQSPYFAEIVINEGKFHQVKRMFEAIGTKVTYLKRISMGPLSLGDLQPGEVRVLTEAELEQLKNR